MKRYGTIMADPPWRYPGQLGPVGRSNNGSGTHLRLDGTPKTQGAARERYDDMSAGDIAALPVGDVALPDAHLYLWFTNLFAVEAHNIARAWGFEPKTILTWVKMRKDGSGRPSMKMGYYYRSATEHILFAVRGRQLTTQEPPRPTAFLAPRAPHSVKPQLFFDLAREQSPGDYLEMFARTRRLGWDAWGREVDSGVVLAPAALPPVEEK